MAKVLLAADAKVGAPSGYYDVTRVTSDPRVAPGLAGNVGSMVEYVTANGAVTLVKYASWDTAWRVPGSGPLYPNTAALFAGATKITPGGLYLNDATGQTNATTLIDFSGNAANLPATNTPTFGQTLEGKVGVWYDGATDKHDANVNDPAAQSFIWGCEGALITDPGGGGVNGFVGRMNGGGQGYLFYFSAGLHVLVRDSLGAASDQVFAGSNAALSGNPRVPYLMVGQLDKAAGRLRARMSRGGAVFATIDVAYAPATLTAGAQTFGFGAVPGGINGGAWNGYGFYGVGAQCEGSDVLRDLAVGLGWEV